MIVDIKYDEPIEVTPIQYQWLRRNYAGVVAHRVDDSGKCYIKLWVMSYKAKLIKDLNK